MLKLPMCNKDFIITEKFLNVMSTDINDFYDNNEFATNIYTNTNKSNLLEVNYIKIFNMFIGRSYNEVAKNISFKYELSSLESFTAFTFITDIKFDEDKRQYIITTRYNIFVLDEFMNPIIISSNDYMISSLTAHYKYDDQNRLIHRYIFDEEYLEISQNVYYEYNDINNALEKVIKIIAPRSNTITKYDIHGRLVSFVHYFNNDQYDYITFSNCYYHDNAIEQISNKTRSIKYYDDNNNALLIYRSDNCLSICELIDIDEQLSVIGTSFVAYSGNNIATIDTINTVVVTKFGVYDSDVSVIYDKNDKKYTVSSKNIDSSFEFFLDVNNKMYLIKSEGFIIYKDDSSKNA